MDREAVLVCGRIALEANQHGALAAAENGLCSAASVEGIGVDTHADGEVHSRQRVVQGGDILHGLKGFEHLNALQRRRAELLKE